MNADMPTRIHPGRLRILAGLCLLAAALSLAGCGSSSKPNSSTNRASARAAAVNYSECMRSHGVPNFPDPDSSGNFSLSGTGIIVGLPSFHAAENACSKLLPGGNPAASNANTAATKRQFLAAAECMRAHGISGFPDPTTGAPRRPPGPGVAVIQNGVSFVLPASINLQSPAVKHAASICGLSGF
jgi:hypothetical protein